jgi:hypothetical protein
VDFLHKGQDLSYPELRIEEAIRRGDSDFQDGGEAANRRLLRSTVEAWLAPRAAAIKRLVLW